MLTPPGVGAIAVVRVRGPGAWERIRACVRRPGGRWTGAPQRDRLYYGIIADGDDEVDDVIIRLVSIDDSGCADIELSCHGGVAVIRRLVRLLEARGFCGVDPDLLAMMSPASGRIEGEVLRLLPGTTTRAAARYLLGLPAGLARRLNAVINTCRGGGLAAGRAALAELVGCSRPTRYLVDPPAIAVVGPVNSGKSSLVNALAGRSAAIAMDRPGATLDYVTADALLEGIAVRLIDSPGIGGAEMGEHQVASERAMSVARAADLRLIVVDVATLTRVSPSIWERWTPLGPWLMVVNKVDLVPAGWSMVAGGRGLIPVSTRTGDGLAGLRRRVLDRLGLGFVSRREPLLVGGLVEALDSVLDAPTSEKLAAGVRLVLTGPPARCGGEMGPIKGI